MRRIETRPWALCLTSLFFFACLLANSESLAQDTNRPANNRLSEEISQVRATPPQIIAGDQESRLSHLRSLAAANDTLSSEELARRVARIYRFQSEILDADATGDVIRTEALLTRAMHDLRALAQRPGIMEQQRFRELYRSIMTEYEAMFGYVDSLQIEQGDIFEVRAEMFAAMNRVSNPLLEDVMIGGIRPMQATFPLEVNRLVEQSIAFLQRSPERHLFHWLARAETYFPMIEEILREEGVPDELKYLAMIESGLNPQARSWAGAGGMWQFMPATGRMYGLNITNWVDERNDPEKATRAAARHLRDLYEMFGDWQLALAGYNWGPGGVNRAIRRIEPQLGRRPNYWDIWNNIPAETRNYVPMFIATALVASNPESFNLRPTRSGPRYEYDHVPVPGMVSLNTIASMAGTDAATIRALNPELRQNTTPPGREYMLRLPFGSYRQFASSLGNLPQGEVQGATTYTVRRGETLSSIARQFGTTVAAMQQTNNLRGNALQVGQTLTVPTVRSENAFGSDFRPGAARQVQYATHMRRPIDMASVRNAVAATSSNDPVVRTTQATTSTPVRTASAAPAPAPAPASTRTIYRVRRGDTLTDIARRHGVTVANLQQWNNIRGSRINVGQRLTIHSSGTASASAAPQPAAQPRNHTVSRGETLSAIARRYGVTVNQLRSWNSIRGDRITVGQRLRVSG